VEVLELLTNAEKLEVLDLSAQGAEGRLPPDKERRLRALVAHELPRLARAPWEEIQYTATFMVGVWDMTGSLDEAEAET
jgi:hypothetical protein